ncbi:MAG: glycosyltransferase family 4 protein [Acidobacteriota bacterium]
MTSTIDEAAGDETLHARALRLTGRRIVHVVPHLNVNGGIKVALQQAEILGDLGLESLVATPRPASSPFPRYRATLATWDAVEPRASDIVIGHWPEALERFVAAHPDRRRMRRIYHAQACFYTRRDQPRDEAPDLDVYAQHTVLRPDIELFAVSREVQRYFLYAFGRPSRRVPNWIDTRLFTPDPSLRVRGRVGLLRHRDYGGDNSPADAPLVDALDARGFEVVVLAGSEEEVADGLRRCELFVSASRGEPNGWRRTEGFQLPTAEAMACGCLVVSVDTGGVGDHLIDGATGVLVDADDSVDAATLQGRLVAATVRVAHNPDRTLLAERAATTVRTAFCRERVAEQLVVALAEPAPSAPRRPVPSARWTL